MLPMHSESPYGSDSHPAEVSWQDYPGLAGLQDVVVFDPHRYAQTPWCRYQPETMHWFRQSVACRMTKKCANCQAANKQVNPQSCSSNACHAKMCWQQLGFWLMLNLLGHNLINHYAMHVAWTYLSSQMQYEVVLIAINQLTLHLIYSPVPNKVSSPMRHSDRCLLM